ncbi:hypothetical protein FRC07_005143 [Ceratobasidium sp. 392]|nr:hypothetical protein FRC07_005143 [Ceratobasidium sp. 392]
MFPMLYYGPVLEEVTVYKYPKGISKMLVLPAAISSSDLVLCGTAVSEVNVVHRTGLPAFVIKGTITEVSDSEMVQPATCNPPAPTAKKHISVLKQVSKSTAQKDPYAKVASNRAAKTSDATVADRNYLAKVSALTTIAAAKLARVERLWLQLESHLVVSYFAIGFALMTVILATTPPGASSFSETRKPSDDKQIYKAKFDADKMLMIWPPTSF